VCELLFFFNFLRCVVGKTSDAHTCRCVHHPVTRIDRRIAQPIKYRPATSNTESKKQSNISHTNSADICDYCVLRKKNQKVDTIPKVVFAQDSHEILISTHRKTAPLQSTGHSAQYLSRKNDRSVYFEFCQFLGVFAKSDY
jgi:hypothetical protein